MTFPYARLTGRFNGPPFQSVPCSFDRFPSPPVTMDPRYRRDLSTCASALCLQRVCRRPSSVEILSILTLIDWWRVASIGWIIALRARRLRDPPGRSAAGILVALLRLQVRTALDAASGAMFAFRPSGGRIFEEQNSASAGRWRSNTRSCWTSAGPTPVVIVCLG